MDESAATSAGSAKRRPWLAPALALALSVTVGLGLVSAAVLSVAPADRVPTAGWISVAVVAACTAIATAVHMRGMLAAEQQHAAMLAGRLARSEARVAADRAAATEQHAATADERTVDEHRRSAAPATAGRPADSRALPSPPATSPNHGPIRSDIGTGISSRYLLPPAPDSEPGTGPGAAHGSNDRGDRHGFAGHSVAEHDCGLHPVGTPVDDATTTTVLPTLGRGSTSGGRLPGPGIFGGAVPPDPAPNPSSACSLGAFQRAVTGRARDRQPSDEPIPAPGHDTGRGARHATTTDRENHR